MRTKELLLFLTLLSGSAFAEDLIVTATTPRIISSPVTYDNVFVESGGRLTVDAPLTVLGNMTIMSGGVVTHSRYPTNAGSGISINASGTVRIGKIGTSSGSINISGMGLRGAGTNGSPYGARGEVYNATGTAVVQGNAGGVGGSYGGIASGGNAAYGLLETPDHFGSGGSGCNFGGNGGGFVAVSADSIVLNGTISADGTNGGSCVYGGGGGGGSGGGVRLTCNTLTGTGLITAVGGNGSNTYQTSGGGGRVAIHADALSGFDPESQIDAHGGPSPDASAMNGGTAGTIFVRLSRTDADVHGSLIVNNVNSTASTLSTPMMTTLAAFDRLTIRDRGRLTISTNTAFDHQVLVKATGWLTVSAGSLAVNDPDAADLRIESAGGVQLRPGSSLLADNVLITGSSSRLENQTVLDVSAATFQIQNLGYCLNTGTMTMAAVNGTTLNGGSLYNRGMLHLVDDHVKIVSGSTLYEDALLTDDDEVASVTIFSGGKLRHSRYGANDGSGLRFTARDSVWVQDGGSIDVIGCGLRGAGTSGSPYGEFGEVYDASGTAVVQGNAGGVGGSYGGIASGGNAAYGLLETPDHFGSGGSGCNFGGNGGGLVVISADVISLNGTVAIKADGTSGGSCVYGGGGGGGSGGGVRLTCNTLTGTGLITAVGGSGSNTYQTSGGGGRVAIYVDSMSGFNPETQVSVCGGLAPAGSTTIPGSAGTLFIQGAQSPSGYLIIDNETVVSSLNTPLRTALATFDSFLLRNKGRLSIFAEDTASLTVQQVVQLTGSSVLTLNAGLAVDFERIRVDGSRIDLPDGYVHKSGTIELVNGVVRSSGTLTLANTVLEGTGTVDARVINGGTINAGDNMAPSASGLLAFLHDLTLTAASVVECDIDGPTIVEEYDAITVSGMLVIGGQLQLRISADYEPGTNARFNLISSASLHGEFGRVDGIPIDRYGLAFIDTDVVLVAGSDIRARTTADAVLCPTPAATAPFAVTLRNGSGEAVVGASNVWLDLGASGDIYACGPVPRIVNPAAPSDSTGKVEFFVGASGYTQGFAEIVSSHGSIGTVPVRPFDRNADMYVTPLDYMGDQSNDFDGDGDSDTNDWRTFVRHLGESCISRARDYINVDVTTEPGPEAIFVGDTIQIVVRVENTIRATAVLDSVVFKQAGWGIAQPWTNFGAHRGVLLGPLETATIVQDFVVPVVGHGCFQGIVYPRYIPIPGRPAQTVKATTDTVMYGVRLEEGRQWAFIETGDGQELAACPYDSTEREELAFLRLYGEHLDYNNSVRNDLRDALIVSPAGARAAYLWEGDFPGFIGTLGERAILGRLSAWLCIVYDLANESSFEKGAGCQRTNGCGPEGAGGLIAWAIPELDFHGACNTHDLCYRQMNGTNDCSSEQKQRCDLAFWENLDYICETLYPTNSNDWGECMNLAEAYYKAVKKYGQIDCCCENNPCAKGCPCSAACPCNEGCECTPACAGLPSCNPEDYKKDQENRDSRRVSAGASRLWSGVTSSKTRGQSQVATSMRIPVGAEEGDELMLVTAAPLPQGWSYSISHSGVIATPDTIDVEIVHDRILKCEDRGTVILYAYGDGQYVGEAVLDVYPIGVRGDIDSDGNVDNGDRNAIGGYLWRNGLEPDPIETADVTEDQRIDIADFVFLVDYLAGAGVDPRACGDGLAVVADTLVYADATWDSVVTTVRIDSAIGLKGIEFKLMGVPDVVPVSLLPGNVEMSFGWDGEILTVGMADWDGLYMPYSEGQGPIPVFTILGEYTLVGARAADSQSRSCPVGVRGMSTSVVLTRFSASSGMLGIDLQWAVASSDVIGFVLERQQYARAEWVVLAELPIAAGDAGQTEGGYFYSDNAVEAGVGYTYRLSAVDAANARFVLGSTDIVFAPPRPKHLDISQNYPNPFNPATRFVVAVPVAQEVAVRIFDLSGRVVRQVFHGNIKAGYHEFSWDGIDESGQSAAAGVYFCNLRGATLDKTVKMLLLK